MHSAAPKNHFVEQLLREEMKMFPKQALRELIANALVHQNFQVTGASVMIEMYTALSRFPIRAYHRLPSNVLLMNTVRVMSTWPT